MSCINPYLSSFSCVLYPTENVLSCYFKLMFPSFIQSGTFRTSFQMNVESGFRYAVQIHIVLFVLSDWSGSGDQCAALCLSMFHLQCFLADSTLFTYTFSLLPLIYLFLLPPLRLSTSQFKRRCITLISGLR